MHNLKLKQGTVTRRGALLSILAAMLIVASTLAVQRWTGAFGEPAGAEHTVARPDDAQVRIAARAVGDGRVEIALQSIDHTDQWSELHLPPARFISSDSEPGHWRYSNRISVPTYWPLPTSLEEAEYLIRHGTEGLFSSNSFVCFIGHQRIEDDLFWNWVATTAANASFSQRLRMRSFYSPDGAEQAAAIRQCTADGAYGIAATLANFEAVGEALQAASAAGVNVLTYNSGRSRSRDVGAFAHLSLDDEQGGVLVAEQLNQAGVSGEVWCLIHERINVGLEERCDGLERAYSGGTVKRVRIHTAELQSAAAADLPDSGAAAVIALNVDSTLWALGLAQQAGLHDLFIAGFGADQRSLIGLLAERIRFIVWDQPIMQGALGIQALLAPDWTLGHSALEFGGAHILIEPSLVAKPQILEWFAALPPEQRLGMLEAAGVSAEQIEALGLGE